MTQQCGLSDPLLAQFIEGAKVGRPTLRVALWLHWIVLKGCDLGQVLLVEQSQPLLLQEDVLAVESHPFSFDPIVFVVPSSIFSSLERLEELIFMLLWGLDIGDGLML